MRCYHVAHESWEPGQPLVCRDRLGDAAPPWKWEAAEEGFDSDVVCLFDDLDAARDFQRLYGGRLVAVDLPDGLEEPGDEWDDITDLDPYGYGRARLLVVDEGYLAITDGVPAAWLTPLD